MHSFQKLVSDFGDFQTLCGWRACHRENTTCKWVCEMNRGIHCKSESSFMGLTVNAGISIWNEESSAIANLSHPLWGSQSMQELASGMRKVLPFLITDAKSSINCEPHTGCPRFAKSSINCGPHKGCPRFAINASIHLSHTHLHFVLSLWRALQPQGLKITKIWN